MSCAECGCIIESDLRIVVCSNDCCCRELPVSEESARGLHPYMSEAPESGDRRAQHWDWAYEDRGPTGVSWFQPTATPSIELIERLGVPKDAAVIDIGGGASLLVDALVGQGFNDLSVLDLSETALQEVRARLGPSAPVALLHEDLLGWKPERPFDLWRDRAVFHFLVNRSDRETYLQTLRSALRPGGALVMATFAVDGPEYCSGLPVARYSPADLAEILGPEFEIVEQFRSDHVTPAGVTQPFTWVAARRIGAVVQRADRRRNG
jgi:SAM-dependent methyltransferase